jgi:hypothetical protein
MLPLDDPLWKKLDDAHRDRDIPKLLSRLAKAWNDENANSLFWNCLCHQETCYGATYAAIPHLLRIAKPERNRHQRLEIAHFCGFVVLCALDPSRGSKFLQGFPETVDEWDEKLDVFRSLAEHIEDAGGDISYHSYEQTELSRYKKLLAIGPVDVDDLDKIESIRADFFKALPKIRGLCERALLENLQDESVVRHLLGGVAAAGRLLDLARLLVYGPEGHFSCLSCDWCYEYILFGDRVAIYADERPSSQPHKPEVETRAFLDFKEGAATRRDGFILPVHDSQVSDRRAAALLSLAVRATSAQPALLLRHFLGSFECCRCGAQGPIHPA